MLLNVVNAFMKTDKRSTQQLVLVVLNGVHQLSVDQTCIAIVNQIYAQHLVFPHALTHTGSLKIHPVVHVDQHHVPTSNIAQQPKTIVVHTRSVLMEVGYKQTRQTVLVGQQTVQVLTCSVTSH